MLGSRGFPGARLLGLQGSQGQVAWVCGSRGLIRGPGEWEGSRCSLSWSGVQGSGGSLGGWQAGAAANAGCPGAAVGLGRVGLGCREPGVPRWASWRGLQQVQSKVA